MNTHSFNLSWRFTKFAFVCCYPIVHSLFNFCPGQVFQSFMLLLRVGTVNHFQLTSKCNVGTELFSKKCTLFTCQFLDCHTWNKSMISFLGLLIIFIVFNTDLIRVISYHFLLDTLEPWWLQIVKSCNKDENNNYNITMFIGICFMLIMSDALSIYVWSKMFYRFDQLSSFKFCMTTIVRKPCSQYSKIR